MKKKVEIKEVLMTAHQVCVELRFNQNTRDYVIHKYNDESHTLREWKNLFNKDGLSI